MATVKRWTKWGTILGVVATLLTIIGTLAGASWAVISDRSNVIQRIAVAEERAIQQSKETGDRLQTVDSRLATQDDRWSKLEPRLDSLAQDMAVSKAILERIERRVDGQSPAVHSFDGHPQQDQQSRTLTEGQGVGKVLHRPPGPLDADLHVPAPALPLLKQ